MVTIIHKGISHKKKKLCVLRINMFHVVVNSLRHITCAQSIFTLTLTDIYLLRYNEFSI